MVTVDNTSSGNLFQWIRTFCSDFDCSRNRERSQEFLLEALVRPSGPKFKAEGWEWGRGSCVFPTPHQLGSQGSTVSYPSRVPQMYFRQTNSPKNAPSGRKCRLLPISWFDLAEPLDATGKTLMLKNTVLHSKLQQYQLFNLRVQSIIIIIIIIILMVWFIRRLVSWSVVSIVSVE